MDRFLTIMKDGDPSSVQFACDAERLELQRLIESDFQEMPNLWWALAASAEVRTDKFKKNSGLTAPEFVAKQFNEKNSARKRTPKIPFHVGLALKDGAITFSAMKRGVPRGKLLAGVSGREVIVPLVGQRTSASHTVDLEIGEVYVIRWESGLSHYKPKSRSQMPSMPGSNKSKKLSKRTAEDSDPEEPQWGPSRNKASESALRFDI